MIDSGRITRCLSALAMGLAFSTLLLAGDEADNGANERPLPHGAIMHLGAEIADKSDPSDDKKGPSTEYPLAFSPDGLNLATGDYPARSWDRSVVLWDVKTGKKLRRLHVEKEELMGLVFSPDGRTLAWGGYGKIHLWNLATNQIRLQLNTLEQTNITSLVFSADSQRVAAIGGKNVHIWDAATGQDLQRFSVPDGRGRSVALSPDGTRVAAAMGTEIFVKGIADGRDLHRVPDPTGNLQAVAFSPDGKQLLAAGMRRLQLWDAATWERRLDREFENASFFHLAFAPLGDTFAVGDADSLRLYDANSNDRIVRFEPYEGISDFSVFAYSPDGKTLATTDDRGAVLIWEIEQLRTAIDGPPGEASANRTASAEDRRQAFFEAIAEGGFADVARSIKADPQFINAKYQYGGTPLYWSAFHGREKIAALLLEHGVDVDARGIESATPLYEASYRGHAGTSKLLLEHRADIEAANDRGYTPLYAAVSRSHDDVVEALLKGGANPNGVQAKAKQLGEEAGGDASPLALALTLATNRPASGKLERDGEARRERSRRIAKALIAHPKAELNRLASGTLPLLHVTVNAADVELTSLLLEHGADPNAQSGPSPSRKPRPYGFTALHLAAAAGNTELVKLLQEHGANPDIKNSLGQTPADLLRKRQ